MIRRCRECQNAAIIDDEPCSYCYPKPHNIPLQEGSPDKGRDRLLSIADKPAGLPGLEQTRLFEGNVLSVQTMGRSFDREQLSLFTELNK